MQYFADTVETIDAGVGFSMYDGTHLFWLMLAAVSIFANCLLYRKLGSTGRSRWKKIIAALIVADELFKIGMLVIGGNYLPKYLPLHLCSINIFLIAAHAWKPSDTIGSFLYTVCIPGALAALLFPSWTELPAANFMHIHSFTVHILLVMYPMVLVVNSELKIDPRLIPKCLLLLVGLAMVALGANLAWDTNFMFLMEAETGNPLAVFEQLFGNHLIGFPILIAAVLAVMYVPVLLYRKRKRKTSV